MLRTTLKWMGTDGLLHFLSCYAMMLTFFPFIGWYALIPTFVAAIGKELYDLFIEKDNTAEQVRHDLICDAAGALAASLIIAAISIL